MGFSAEHYPSLPGIVRAYVGGRKELSSQVEDDIVAEILEELLLLSPKTTPVASGSGSRQPPAKQSLSEALFG